MSNQATPRALRARGVAYMYPCYTAYSMATPPYVVAAGVDSLGYPPLALALVAASATILLLFSKKRAAAFLLS